MFCIKKYMKLMLFTQYILFSYEFLMSRMIMIITLMTVRSSNVLRLADNLWSLCNSGYADYFYLTGHGRIYEYIKTIDGIARHSGKPTNVFQNESLHRWVHQHIPSFISSSVEKKVQHFFAWHFTVNVESLSRNAV